LVALVNEDAVTINLQHKDCLSFLKDVPDNSVDLIVTDPPYYRIVNQQWDKQWKTEDEYLQWCKEWTIECARVLKPERCLYVWGTTKTDTFLRYKLEILNKLTNMSYNNWIIWSYDWGGRTKQTFARKHEDLLMYSKGENFLFNADSVRIPYKVTTNVRKGAINNPLGKIPTDVWEKNNHTASKEYCEWHPTQKPIELLKRIILANSNEGDTVMDIFNGSGSTMIAAKMTNRKFIGCEMNEEYYKKSLERMEKLCSNGQNNNTSNDIAQE